MVFCDVVIFGLLARNTLQSLYRDWRLVEARND
jgi:hypothetical protein